MSNTTPRADRLREIEKQNAQEKQQKSILHCKEKKSGPKTSLLHWAKKGKKK